MSVGELLKRIPEDPDAFQEIDRSFRKPLLVAAQRMTRDPFAAEDLVQETMLRAFLALRKGEFRVGIGGEKRFFHWLIRVARRIWVDERKADYLRRQREHVAAKSLVRGSTWDQAHLYREKNSGPDPVDILTPRQRETARRYYSSGETYGDIEASLGVSVATVERDVAHIRTVAAGRDHANQSESCASK